MYQWRKQARPAGRLLADLGPRLPQNSIYLFLNNNKKKSKSRRVVEGSASLDGIYRWAGRGDRSMADLSRRSPCNGGRAHRRDGAGPLGWQPLGWPHWAPFFLSCPLWPALQAILVHAKSEPETVYIHTYY